MTKKYGVSTEDADNESYEMAKELLEREELLKEVTSQDIEFVLLVMTKEAPHDKQSIKQLFLGMLSAFTKLPLHHAISSKDSGAGKSYLLVLVAGYIPKMYVVALTGMSDKAMLHKAGTLVVEDDDGEPVPLDPLLERLGDNKEELVAQLNNLPKVATSKDQRRELKKAIADIKAEIMDLKMKTEKLIVLENKIILLLDTTQDSLFNALMSLVSQDTKDDQKYEYVDTSSNAAIGTKSNRFQGTPAIFTCQVVDDSRQVRYAEKNRRFIHVIPDTSSEKIRTAMDHIGLRYGLLPEEYDIQVISREDKEKAKEICSRIVKKLISHSQYFQPKDSGIKVLFPKSITRSIVMSPNDVWGMTVAERINKYLAVITKMNMDSRPRFIDNDVPKGKKFYPISTFDDVKETLELMGPASSTLRPYIVNWYNQVFLPAFDDLDGEPFSLKDKSSNVIMQEIHLGVNSQRLGDKTAEVFGLQKPNSEDLLNHYLYPLLNLGIIDKAILIIEQTSTSQLRQGQVNVLFSDPNDPRLEVTDPDYYPNKKSLEDTCRTIIEYCYKAGGVNERKYRLVDHEGKDITPQELVDRYLYNPEVCFKEFLNNSSTRSKNNTPSLACSNILTEFSNSDKEQSSTPMKPEQETEIEPEQEATKPIKEWKPEDFSLHGCIYCTNSGGYHGPFPLTASDYERHVVKKHPGKPAYPGPADIEKYQLKHSVVA